MHTYSPQVLRKRLNKSSSNSSSLNYVDWDAKDGAFDPAASKIGMSRQGISKHLGSQRNEILKNQDNNEEEPDTDHYNQENFLSEINLRNPDQHSQTIYLQDPMRRPQTPLMQNDGRDHVTYLGGKANYSLPEVDYFVEKFQAKYQFSNFAVNSQSKYSELLKKLLSLRKKGPMLPSYMNKQG